jgi:nucleoside-diphosphate-sugar epimerase
MLEAERLLASAAGVALRLGGIYGPGRTRLIDGVRAGRATIRPGPPRWTNRIHRDDAAGALRHLIGCALAGAALEAVYVGVDDEPADDAVVLRWLSQRLGAPPPPGADDAAPPGRSGNKRCRNARLRATGYAFAYPSFREGYGALIDATSP